MNVLLTVATMGDVIARYDAVLAVVPIAWALLLITCFVGWTRWRKKAGEPRVLAGATTVSTILTGVLLITYSSHETDRFTKAVVSNIEENIAAADVQVQDLEFTESTKLATVELTVAAGHVDAKQQQDTLYYAASSTQTEQTSNILFQYDEKHDLMVPLQDHSRVADKVPVRRFSDLSEYLAQ